MDAYAVIAFILALILAGLILIFKSQAAGGGRCCATCPDTN